MISGRIAWISASAWLKFSRVSTRSPAEMSWSLYSRTVTELPMRSAVFDMTLLYQIVQIISSER